MTSTASVRPRPQYRAADLLTAYLPGSFYWSSTRGSLLADGVRAHVEGRHGDRAAAVAAALSAVGDPAGIAAGAIGFGPESPASLVVPAVVRRAPPVGPDGWPAAPAPMPGAPQRVRRRPEPERYARAVAQALTWIGDGRLSKVVLARCVEMTGSAPVEVPWLLQRLVAADPAAYAFATDVTPPGAPATRTLVGASPELLVARDGDAVTANPLAGSAPRSPDPVQDRARATALLASEKDRHEHAFVVARVAEVLGRYCIDLDVPANPELAVTATMWHLSSRVTGRVADRAHSALTIAEALHPTPAVCGTPVDVAQAAIAELECGHRGYYSGLVGWTDMHGDGEWAVTIRSAEVSGSTVVAHAGAGIVAGSDPAAELAETGDKLGTLLRALGVQQQR